MRTFTQGRLVPRQPWAIKGTTRTELRDENIRGDRCVHWNTGITPTALHHERIYIAKYIHWNTGTIPTALRRYNIQNCEYIHYNIGIKYTALRRYHIYNDGYIHWNTDTTPVALPIGNTLNIDCLHLKNMNIFVDVWAFLSQFFISTHIHFMLLTCKQCLAKLKIRMKKDANFIAYTFTS